MSALIKHTTCTSNGTNGHEIVQNAFDLDSVLAKQRCHLIVEICPAFVLGFFLQQTECFECVSFRECNFGVENGKNFRVPYFIRYFSL